MNKLIRSAIVLALTIFLALSCTMIAFSTKPPKVNNTVGAALIVQTTPTPQAEKDRSEVGSTDGIIIMGGVIVLIVLLPILAGRKSQIRAE